ncbi:hypothetical protein QUA79_19990 [Microcoleus sp. F8-D1]
MNINPENKNSRSGNLLISDNSPPANPIRYNGSPFVASGMESRQDYFSDSDSDALARVALGEGENSQQLGGLNLAANGVIKGRASNLFNVTEEEVENPQYWIDL